MVRSWERVRLCILKRFTQALEMFCSRMSTLSLYPYSTESAECIKVPLQTENFMLISPLILLTYITNG